MSPRGREPLTPAELRGRVVITVPEHAATFFADERTVRRDIQEGRLQAIQVGTTWRILVAPLLQQCGLADAETAEFDLEDSEAVSPTDTATRSDIRPLKAINRCGHFDPPAA
jgi:hypothetical protein